MFVTGMWTSLPSYHSISWPIDWVFRRGLVIVRWPERTAFLTAFPRAAMGILIMGGAQTQARVLDLTTPAAAQRHNGRIAAYPLLATRRLHSRRRGITTKATLCTGKRLGFHPSVRHCVPLA